MATIQEKLRRPLIPVTAVALVGGFSGMLGFAAPAASASVCSDTGVAGETAAVVATAGEHITGPIDATGCDVGVFVGPNAGGVTISKATITGANNQGVLVLAASHVTVVHNVVEGNGAAPGSEAEDKPIDMVGTSHSSVIGNLVRSNLADGAIALNDDGGFNPAIPGGPGNSTDPLHPSTGNVVSNNTVIDNVGGCGVVLSSYNPGAGVIGNTVVGNDLVATGTTPYPVMSSIVLAGQLVQGNQIVNNTIVGSGMPGIILHSNSPAEALIGNLLTHNTLSGDDWLKTNGPDSRVGILLGGGEPGSMAIGQLSGTRIVANRISNEDVGIYLNLQPADGPTTRLEANRFSNVPTPVEDDTP